MTIDENINRRFFFLLLFRSFFWSPIVKEKMFQKFIHSDLSKVVLTRAVGCSRLSVSKHFTLIFELRSADCLESMPLLSSKTPKKNSSCKCNVTLLWVITRCAFAPSTAVVTTNNQSQCQSVDQNGVTDAIRTVGRACTPLVLRSLIRLDCRQLNFAAVLSFYPFWRQLSMLAGHW